MLDSMDQSMHRNTETVQLVCAEWKTKYMKTRWGSCNPDAQRIWLNVQLATYGLSLREFSKFLGFGEQTTYRYEHGDIPDQPHNTTMLSAKTIEGARLLLAQNRGKLNDRSIARIEQRIQAMVDGAAEHVRAI